MDKDVTIKADVNTYINSVIQEKIIVASHKDTCNLCFEEVSVGDSICWYGRKMGVRHLTCYLKRSSLLTQEEFDKLSDW